MKSISSPIKQLLLFFAVLICSWTATATDVSAGTLEPPAAPAPTMRTLEEQKPAWNKIIPANQRFMDALDGSAVLDKETGLVWAKSPPSTTSNWEDAMVAVPKMTIGGRRGWRVPTLAELSSLLDMNRPVVFGQDRLPLGHPFTNVQQWFYWSSDQAPTDAFLRAWAVNLGGETVEPIGDPPISEAYPVWPVRGGR